jgi:ATP-dependent RNA helicase DeaD
LPLITNSSVLATFKELGISDNLIKALNENEIYSPSGIQTKAIPFLLNTGSDFIGQAQTGTGKTAAFGLPLLQRVDPELPVIQALILCPTRELAQQIAKQLFRFTKYSEKIFTEAVYGGEKIDLQISALRRTTHIVVATPGRLIDLLEKKAIDLSNLKTIVLDEADEMLSMGFKAELDKILTFTTGKRSTWLFSATMPEDVKSIISNYMSKDAYRVSVDKKDVVNALIEHQFVVVEEFEKLDILLAFLKSQGANRGIIFCRTKAATQLLSKQLQAKNMAVDAIHGDLMQIERDKVMRAVKNQKIKILIATDISARGIDIPDLSYVAHYQLPDQIDYYTHRSGRTARGGKKGISIAFVEPKEVNRIKLIEKELGIKIREIKR